jgi:hypothetical protein
MKKVGQRSWVAGGFAAEAPSLVPTVGALGLLNVVLDDEGSLRRRGGCTYVSDALGTLTSVPLFLFAGALAAGQRVVVASPQGQFVLAADGHTLVKLPVPFSFSRPTRGVVLAGLLLVNSGNDLIVTGGSRLAAFYSAGTVTVTNGSKVVTGAGTSWLANADAGMVFQRFGGDPWQYAVASVDSNTQVTLREPYRGATAAGVTYQLSPHISASGSGSLTGSSAPWVAIQNGALIGTIAGRLVVAQGSKLYFSDAVDAGLTNALLAGSTQLFSFPAGNVHEFPDGAEILAVATIRDRLFVFTTVGVFVISNMAYEKIGPDGSVQHRIEHYSKDVIAISGGAGITTFKDALVVPAADDIYLMDGLAAPEPITRGPRRDWRSNVKNGYVAGNGSIFRGHYVMPLVDSATNNPVETWLFRLDRPIELSGGVVFPWSQLIDQGGELGAVAVRETSPRQLLAGGISSGPVRGRVLDITRTFDVGPTNWTDADASNVVAFITTRDFSGDGLRTLWRFMRLRVLMPNNGVGVLLQVRIGEGGDTVLGTPQTFATIAPADVAHGRITWAVQRMMEFARFTIQAEGGTEFVLYEFEAEYEGPGR